MQAQPLVLLLLAFSFLIFSVIVLVLYAGMDLTEMVAFGSGRGNEMQRDDRSSSLKSPVDGNWGSWSDVTDCSSSCGNGQKLQERQCDNPAPANDGNYCPGPSSRYVVCSNRLTCPINGNWGSWEDSSDCSTSCEKGQKLQERKCNNPPPANHGSFCQGPLSQFVDCNTEIECPIDGNWGSWEDSSACFTTCGKGQKVQERQCDNPPPQNNGSDCQGPLSQFVDCDTKIQCPIDGNWGSWEDASVCSTSCGKGQKVQKRQCNNPTPAYKGSFCQGSPTQYVDCNSEIICTGGVSWGSWADASACSSSCGRGQKVQKRSCNSLDPSKPVSTNVCIGPSSQSVDCYYGIPCPNHTKALVIGGCDSKYVNTDTVEVIDLTSIKTTCANVSKYPFPNRGTLGGLIDDSIPMICGGNIPTVSYCYYYTNNSWVTAPSMTTSRGHGTGISLFPFGNSLQKFLATGGETPITSEIFNGIKWTTSNLPSFSAPLYVSCITYAHDSTLMLTGGIISTWIGSTKTFIMNQTYSQWVPGPSLIMGRYGHGCGTILNDKNGTGLSIITVGGLMKNNNDPISTVEVLDKGAKVWRRGPSLPVPIGSASLVTDSFGQVILIGGLNAESKLYRLQHAGITAQWELMPKQLKTPRTWLLALTVPDSIARCQ